MVQVSVSHALQVLAVLVPRRRPPPALLRPERRRVRRSLEGGRLPAVVVGRAGLLERVVQRLLHVVRPQQRGQGLVAAIAVRARLRGRRRAHGARASIAAAPGVAVP